MTALYRATTLYDILFPWRITNIVITTV